MDDIKDLQEQLQEVQHRMDLDLQNGLGWACEDVHLAGELMSRITKIRLESEGSV